MAESAGDNTAEAWLLPELGAAQVVSAKRRAGFGQRAAADGDTVHADGAAAATANGEPRGPFTRSRIDALARAAREKGHDDGRAEGYQKGYAEGEARARELGLQQSEQQRQQMQQLLDALTVQVSDAQQQLADALTAIVRKIARAVCLRELGDGSDASIAAIVAQALAALPLGEKHIVFRLHPEDIELLQQQPGLLKSDWQINGDETLQRGDVIVDSEFSRVDASVEKRLDEILRAVFDTSDADAQTPAP